MLDKYYENAIIDASESLKNDGVIIVPTDTLYGLAALSSSKVGIDRVFEIKNRDKSKLLPVVVNSLKMFSEVSSVNMDCVKRLSKFFPGSLTIVAKRNPNFDYYDAKTVAIRMIDSPLINTIIDRVNCPLALTSANLSNEENIIDPIKLIETFEGVIDCVFLDSKIKNVASTIVEIKDDGSLKLIREGKIDFEHILKEYNSYA